MRAQMEFCGNTCTHTLNPLNENMLCMYIFVCHSTHTPAVFAFWQLSNPFFFFLLSGLFSRLQWRNVWAPCRWGPRWWSSAAAPRDWCGSSIWTNTSPASAGGPRARMKRPRVSVFFLLPVTREQLFKLPCTCNSIIHGSNFWKAICDIFHVAGKECCQASHKRIFTLTFHMSSYQEAQPSGPLTIQFVRKTMATSFIVNRYWVIAPAPVNQTSTSISFY